MYKLVKCLSYKSNDSCDENVLTAYFPPASVNNIELNIVNIADWK